MSVRSRPMRPKDVRRCVDIIESHPIVGPRYAGVISQLRTAWLKSLGSESFHACVFEEVNAGQVRLLGSGVGAFVSDDFLHEIKSPPFFWFGPELAKRVVSGDSPLLSGKQVKEANATGGGLNLVFWEACMRYEDNGRPELLRENGDAIIENHRGFMIKEWIMQAATLEALQVMLFAGAGSVTRGDGDYSPVTASEVPALFSRPHVIGLTRALAIAKVGSWASNMFIYEPPRFELRPSEQKLLLAALRGSGDDEVSTELGVSQSAVKKTWRSIYERVAGCDPSLLPDVSADGENGTARGRAKKHRLLAYLRDHPEELRPHSPRRSPAPRAFRANTIEDEAGRRGTPAADRRPPRAPP